MKNIIMSVIVTACICIAVAVVAFYISEAIHERVGTWRCDCIGSQQYVLTKYNDGCKITMLDPYGDYDGEGMILYLFNAMEECR